MDCSSLEGFDLSKVSYLDDLCFAGAFNSEKNVSVTLRPEQFLLGGAHFSRSGIKGVTFIENITEPGENQLLPSCCFYKCKNLDTVVLSKSVSTFGVACFEGCLKLTSDILAQTDCAVTYLDYRCLAATGITEITIPLTVTDLPGGVFANAPALKKVNYYSNYYSTTYGFFGVLNDTKPSDVLPYMTDTQYQKISNVNYLKKPEKKGNTFIEELNIYNVNNADWGSYFANQPYLKTVTIHNNEKSNYTLSENMFMFCPELTTVTFDHPEKVIEINSWAFAYCPSLHSFPFEQMTGLMYIGRNAFLLSTDELGFSKEELQAWSSTSFPKANYGLTGVLDLSKCTKLSTIDSAAFEMQYNITGVKIPASVSSYMYSVFIGCTSIKNIIADCPMDRIGQIGRNFSIAVSSSYTNKINHSINCYNDVIENITFNNVNESINNINSSFFSNCVSLKNVTIKNLKVLPSCSFVNCVSLKNVDLPDTETISDQNFFSTGFFTINAPNVTVVNNSGNPTNYYRERKVMWGN